MRSLIVPLFRAVIPRRGLRRAPCSTASTGVHVHAVPVGLGALASSVRDQEYFHPLLCCIVSEANVLGWIQVLAPFVCSQSRVLFWTKRDDL